MHRLKLGRETEERKKLKGGGRAAGITVSKKVNKEGNLFFGKEQATSLAKHFYCGSSLQSQGRASEGVFISSNHWGRDKRACSVPSITRQGQEGVFNSSNHGEGTGRLWLFPPIMCESYTHTSDSNKSQKHRSLELFLIQ